MTEAMEQLLIREKRRGHVGSWMRVVLAASASVVLAACAAATPAPVVYTPQKPRTEPPKRVRRAPEPTPVAVPSQGVDREALPAAAPQGQLPAAAQPPAELPPPAGSPHDSSEYIEPPPR